MSKADTLALAESIAATLRPNGVEPLVIGAAALAAHGYVRDTHDLDLAISVAPSRLLDLARTLERSGRQVSVDLPDSADPLGGVITIFTEPDTMVQLVNYDNSPSGGFPALVRDAHGRAASVVRGSLLRVVDPITLIISKLYAGGRKSQLDIIELLTCCPVDMEELTDRCNGYRMSDDLARVLASLHPND